MPEAKKVAKVAGLMTALGFASYAWVRLAGEMREEIEVTLQS